MTNEIGTPVNKGAWRITINGKTMTWQEYVINTRIIRFLQQTDRTNNDDIEEIKWY